MLKISTPTALVWWNESVQKTYEPEDIILLAGPLLVEKGDGERADNHGHVLGLRPVPLTLAPAKGQ